MSYPRGGQWQHAPPQAPQGAPPQQAPTGAPQTGYPPQGYTQQYQQQYRNAPMAPYPYPPVPGQGQPPPFGAYAAPGGAPPPYGAPHYGYGAPPPYSGNRGPVQHSSATNSYNSTVRSMDVPLPAPNRPGQYYGPGSTLSSGSGAAPGVPGVAHPPAMFKSEDAMFSPDEAARKAFDNADRDKTGYITFREFLESLRNLNIEMPYHDALDRFSKLDVDKDGRICETEFVNGYLRDKLGMMPSLPSR